MYLTTSDYLFGAVIALIAVAIIVRCIILVIRPETLSRSSLIYRHILRSRNMSLRFRGSEQRLVELSDRQIRMSSVWTMIWSIAGLLVILYPFVIQHKK